MNDIRPDGPCREKYWSELDSEQRIERLRTVVKQMTGQLARARSTITKLEDQSERHEHSPNTGLPMMAKGHRWNESDSPPNRIEKPDESYI